MKRSKKMKKVIVMLVVLLSVFSCGYSSVGNEAAGQVKKIVKQTPVFCYNRIDVDVSLGVMRNGVGSMSNQDIWLTFESDEDSSDQLKLLKKAAENGSIVKINYDVARTRFCTESKLLRSIEIIE